MRKRTPWLLGGVVPLLAFALPVQAADVDKFLPDHTEAILTVNVKQMLHGGLVKKYALEPLELALKDGGEIHDILEAVSIDPFHDVHRITAAATAGQTG